MKFVNHVWFGMAIFAAACCLATQQIEAQGSKSAIASSDVKDPVGILSYSLQEILAGSVPVKHFAGPGGNALILTNMGLTRPDYTVAVGLGVMPPNGRFVAPRPDRAHSVYGRVSYFINGGGRLVEEAMDVKPGLIVMRTPSPDKTNTVDSGPSDVIVFQVWFPAQKSTVPMEADAVRTKNVLDFLDTHPLRTTPFAESNLVSNSLYAVKALQLQPGATFTVPFPHLPTYMVVVRGSISINGVRMEKDRIIAARGPGPRPFVIGNPGQETGAVLEIQIIAKAKPVTKPAKLTPPQGK